MCYVQLVGCLFQQVMVKMWYTHDAWIKVHQIKKFNFAMYYSCIHQMATLTAEVTNPVSVACIWENIFIQQIWTIYLVERQVLLSATTGWGKGYHKFDITTSSCLSIAQPSPSSILITFRWPCAAARCNAVWPSCQKVKYHLLFSNTIKSSAIKPDIALCGPNDVQKHDWHQTTLLSVEYASL